MGRPERTMECLCGSEFSSAVCVFKRFIRRAGRAGSAAGRDVPAAEKRRRAAALQDLPDVSTAHRYARSVLEMRQSSGAVGTDSAQFRRDVAAKAFPALRPVGEIGGVWLLKRPADTERLQDVSPTKGFFVQKPDRIVQ
jgi:hypothetical protein